MNYDERRLWVLNDEGLYNWFKSSRKGIFNFIADNKTELDIAINKAMGR